MNTEDLLESFKDSVIKLGVDAVCTYLYAQLPFLNLPVVKQITRMIVNVVIETLVKYTEIGLYFAYVDIAVAKQAADYREAALKHKENPTHETQQAKIDAARNLIRFRKP